MNADEIREYWSDVRASIQNTLVPMAKKAKCISAGATLASLGKVGSKSKLKDGDPKRQAVLSLVMLAHVCDMGDMLVRQHEEMGAALPENLDRAARTLMTAAFDAHQLSAHQEIAPICDYIRVQLSGYLAALHAVTAHRVAGGANGRLRIGDITREKVLAAAPSYRHLPIEQAKVKIAALIGKSPGQVGRILNAAFPARSWRKSIDP